MEEILGKLASLDPEEATSQLSRVLRTFLGTLDEEARARFLLKLFGGTQGDKVSSLVHL
jgi:hypothetical protein